MLPSLSTMEVWKVEAGLFSRVCAMEKAVELVAVDARLLPENPPGALTTDKDLWAEAPTVVVAPEAASVVGEADDPGEPDEPSAVVFFGGFARQSWSLPVYSRLLPPNSREGR